MLAYYSRVIKIIGIILFYSIVMPVFSEPAPVYDADTMQQEMEEGNIDPSQYLPPPPPPPGQETEGVFVPSSPPPVSIEPPATSMNMSQRVQRLEQQINNMQNSDAVARIESLQNQVQTLRGQVEQLTHQLEQIQNQQKSMYSDLDKRLSQSNAGSGKSSVTSSAITASDADEKHAVQDEAVPASTPAPAKSAGKSLAKSSSKAPATMVDTLAAKSTADQPNVAEEQQIYQTAYNLIKVKKYSDAINVLQGMLKKYPSGQFASNAHYWLGELYGLIGKNDLALNEFNAVVKTYPDSPRVSDAQLKVGLILASQLKWPDAKAALKKVINRYPGTASARLASEQLKQIKQAGH
ncbi:MAG: tol-pal system protein YbgF [Gammaproteobacteria bacterium]|nr:tol-pal system protein YbgF [Gammaproteobacteria bacterium]